MIARGETKWSLCATKVANHTMPRYRTTTFVPFLVFSPFFLSLSRDIGTRVGRCRPPSGNPTRPYLARFEFGAHWSVLEPGALSVCVCSPGWRTACFRLPEARQVGCTGSGRSVALMNARPGNIGAAHGAAPALSGTRTRAPCDAGGGAVEGFVVSRLTVAPRYRPIDPTIRDSICC